jgi:hypothetical protein
MFGVETVNIICRERVNPPSYRGAYLDTSIYFFKPIRETLKVTEFPTTPVLDNVLYLTTLSSTVNHIMRIYQVLYSSDCIENGIDLFLFPSGVITGFGDGSGYEDFKVAIENSCKRVEQFQQHFDLRHRPIILFPLLHDYQTKKPPNHLRRSYRDKFRDSIVFLNAAEIAHLDLRPDNIMWKENEDDTATVDIKKIDFETAILFGHFIPTNFIRKMGEDPRYYPIHEGVEFEVASQAHNEFFFNFICLWLDSEIESFDDFMLNQRRNEWR